MSSEGNCVTKTGVKEMDKIACAAGTLANLLDQENQDQSKFLILDEREAGGDILLQEEVLEESTVDNNSKGSGEGEDYDGGLMVLVGPEKFTSKILSIFDQINETQIRMKAIRDLKPEQAGRLRNQDLVYILFIMDSADPNALKEVDDQLSYLHKNYRLAFDRIDFILAQESAEIKKILKAKDIAEFLHKYGQPLINVFFQDGWENETTLKDQMKMFLKRFETLDSLDNDAVPSPR